jgi:hypothetical protein
MPPSDPAFVNRHNELSVLEKLLQRETSDFPVSVIIISPSGFGKSGLTDQLRLRCKIPGLKFCVVDPELQASTIATKVHEGFFVQRCAEYLSTMAGKVSPSWPTLAEFIKNRAAKTISEKKGMSLLSEAPGWRAAYKILLDVASRAFGIGDFSPSALLSSDAPGAVKICREYIEHILSNHSVVLIVRDAHHIDSFSLRSLLILKNASSYLDLIFEYTSEHRKFDPVHQKIFLQNAKKPNPRIISLDRLSFDHFDYLVKRSVNSDFCLTDGVYGLWDGNLRSVQELQFRIAVTQQVVIGEEISSTIENLPKMIRSHAESLDRIQKVVLAVCLAHVESISLPILNHMVTSIIPSTSPAAFKEALGSLVTHHKFLSHSDGAYRVENETVAEAIRNSVSMNIPIAIAEKALRDFYRRLVANSQYSGTGMAAAVRQVFRLCARTKDVAGLLQATEILSSEAKNAHDQSIFIDIVAGAIEATPSLFVNDHMPLVIWAAELAYSAGDWDCVARLISLIETTDSYALVMKACSLQEIGRHDEALQAIADLRKRATDNEERLYADLLEALIVGCRGNHAEARRALDGVISNVEFAGSPLLGYAHRFFEVVDGFESRIAHLLESIAIFTSAGLEKSKAYSQAATSVLVARSGDIETARMLIADAVDVLGADVQDRHLVLNNMAAVELLADAPDFPSCRDLLIEALHYVKDDFSEITVLSNLSLACWGMNDFELATDCVEKTLQILNDHDFADKEIY